MVSTFILTQSDLLLGMACVGRAQDKCLGQKGHAGPVPGVPVGTLWRYRVQCSEDGVHRPLVAGISLEGTGKVAFSPITLLF